MGSSQTWRKAAEPGLQKDKDHGGSRDSGNTGAHAKSCWGESTPSCASRRAANWLSLGSASIHLLGRGRKLALIDRPTESGEGVVPQMQTGGFLPGKGTIDAEEGKQEIWVKII